jgi:hypothetical protein
MAKMMFYHDLKKGIIHGAFWCLNGKKYPFSFHFTDRLSAQACVEAAPGYPQSYNVSHGNSLSLDDGLNLRDGLIESSDVKDGICKR